MLPYLASFLLIFVLSAMLVPTVSASRVNNERAFTTARVGMNRRSCVPLPQTKGLSFDGESIDTWSQV